MDQPSRRRMLPSATGGPTCGWLQTSASLCEYMCLRQRHDHHFLPVVIVEVAASVFGAVDKQELARLDIGPKAGRHNRGVPRPPPGGPLNGAKCVNEGVCGGIRDKPFEHTARPVESFQN